MAGVDVGAIDWTRPWLAPLQALGCAVQAHLRGGASVAAALDQAAAALPDAPRFVPPDACPRGEAYEAFIARSGCIPTRDSLHDLFNGLIWLQHGALKRRLNQLQAQAIAREGIGPVRGPLRDALTLFDEYGAWVELPAVLETAWRARDWKGLFLRERGAWREARVRVIGHALLEQLARAPRKGLCAHGLLLDPLALDSVQWAGKPFLPLPLLGIPGWWAANEEAGFYDDAAVFRPICQRLREPGPIIRR